MIRTGSFFTIRNVLYEEIKGYFVSDVEGCGFWRRWFAAVIPSCIALLSVNFLDIARIKMINDTTPFRYTNNKVAIKSVLQPKNFYSKGFAINSLHLMIYQATEIATQDQGKIMISNKQYSVNPFILNVLVGSLGSLTASILACPFDVVTTRFLSQVGNNEKTIFSKFTTVFFYLLKTEGVGSFYKGFLTYSSRNMIHGGLFFSAYQHVKKNYIDRRNV